MFLGGDGTFELRCLSLGAAFGMDLAGCVEDVGVEAGFGVLLFEFLHRCRSITVL